MNLLNAHKNRILILLSLSLTAGGCGFQAYIAKPIKPDETIQKLESQSPESAQFKEYLIAQNYPQNQFPIKEWGLTELTYSALFFHPDLNVARAQWRAAQSTEITAAQRPELGVNGETQKHSKADGV